MTLSPEMGNLLKITGGVFWSLAYLLIIRRGFKDQTFGMPLAALCANISWEFIFAFVHPHESPQLYVNIAWFLLDTIILFQALRYGPRVFDSLLPQGSFYVVFLLSLLLGFLLILGISIEFNNWTGTYSAFGQDLMMSILFVMMLRRRNDLSGQSLYIAIFKMIGSFVVSIYIYINISSSLLMVTLYISIFVINLLYIILLYAKHQELGVRPWLRF